MAKYWGSLNVRQVFHLLILFAAILIAPSIPLRADANDISTASRSVVRIAIFGEVDGRRQLVGHGSGLVVAPNRIITNAHVVEEAVYDSSLSFLIIPSRGRSIYRATLDDWSPQNDLATLKLENGASLPPGSLYAGPATDGSDVFAIGYPASVDIAMDYSEDDVLRPQAPVKTRGTISSGRSSKSFDSVLHTAPIAPGNSGGPLVDACGRVVGINSFGSTAENGGAEFYFAISVRELSAYLRKQNIRFNAINAPCRSVADLNREEAEREAEARARIEAENRVAAQKRAREEEKARRDAVFDIISARENRIMGTALLLILALAAGGASFVLFERKHRNPAIGAASAGAFLLLGAMTLFVGRPSFDDIEERAKMTVAGNGQKTGPINGSANTGPEITVGGSGKLSCIIQPGRSKITQSNPPDFPFEWADNGCADGTRQFVQQSGHWDRTEISESDGQVSIIHFSPASGTYRIERHFPDQDMMEKIGKLMQDSSLSGCTADPDLIRKMAEMDDAVRSTLPPEPNELLTYKCTGS